MWINREELERLISKINKLEEFTKNISKSNWENYSELLREIRGLKNRINFLEQLERFAKDIILDGDGFMQLSPDIVIISYKTFEEMFERKRLNNDPKCATISTSNKDEFETFVNEKLASGYEIASSSCNTKEFKAIMCFKGSNKDK